MPSTNRLPDSLKPLARLHAVRLTPERFKADAQDLAGYVEKALQAAEARRQSARGGSEDGRDWASGS